MASKTATLPTAAETPRILTVEETAERMRISVGTLAALTRNKKIRYVRIGQRRKFYRPEDIDAALEAMTSKAIA